MLQTTPPYLIEIIIFIFGLCIGSFLNVCIYRLPEESMSVLNPKTSFCPKCNRSIRFYDNIPVLSYILLMGKCRFCKASISFRYPMIEFLSGLFALCVFFKFGLTWEMIIYYILISSLLVITFIDLDHQIIPDVISLPGIFVGFAASFILPDINWKTSLIGIIAGGGSFYLIAVIYSLIKKIDGMGGGDIKLLAMLGAFFGLKGVLFIIFVSSAVGTVVGTITMIGSKDRGLKFKIPFGPFLSFAAMLYIFWGNEIIFWYVNIMR
ncbi:leader peptidase (prepilin peptidase) / N-methyltransferase [Candidatus Magnetomoraceae bacterium gMMP-1]